MAPEIRKNIWIDVLAWPYSLIPAGVGASALLLSWAGGGVLGLTVAGTSFLLASVGLMVSRYVLCLDTLIERAYAQKAADRIKNTRKRMKTLADGLSAKKLYRFDSRQGINPEGLACQLSLAYEKFHRLIGEQTASSGSRRAVSQPVEEMAELCLTQLEEVSRWADEGYGLGAKEKQKRLDAIREGVRRIDAVGSEFSQLGAENRNDELLRMGTQLERNLRVATDTEQQMRDLANGTDSKVEEYL